MKFERRSRCHRTCKPDESRSAEAVGKAAKILEDNATTAVLNEMITTWQMAPKCRDIFNAKP